MDMYEFRALNPGVSAGDLRPGDEITLIVAATTSRPNPFRVSARENNGSQMEVTRYPSERQRKTTTSGDLYNPEALTAAHPSLALGSVVYIENPGNGRGFSSI
jgi:rare lipoprotein A (peptidoglycan hydrolase)